MIAGIKVVTFDTVIEDEEGNAIPEVTTMFQNDQEMARLSLDYIVNVLFPDTPACETSKTMVRTWDSSI